MLSFAVEDGVNGPIALQGLVAVKRGVKRGDQWMNGDFGNVGVVIWTWWLFPTDILSVLRKLSNFAQA